MFGVVFCRCPYVRSPATWDLDYSLGQFQYNCFYVFCVLFCRRPYNGSPTIWDLNCSFWTTPIRLVLYIGGHFGRCPHNKSATIWVYVTVCDISHIYNMLGVLFVSFLTRRALLLGISDNSHINVRLSLQHLAVGATTLLRT